MVTGVLLKLPTIPFPLSLRYPFHSHSSSSISSLQFQYSTPATRIRRRRSRMALTTHNKAQQINSKAASFQSGAATATQKQLPIFLFDIMDTVVRDPFYHDVPAFFRMSFEELIESKHPTAWIEFEKGIIDEAELERTFFKDGRPLDMEGLKNCMRKGYSYVEGIEELLHVLKHKNYEMHAFTNYPIWYEMIEDKLNISKYLSWTFCSCMNGKRKPDPEFYLEVVRHLKVDPASCIFVDDRMRNVEAAMEIGITGLHFKNADLLRQDLSLVGIDIPTNQTKLAQE